MAEQLESRADVFNVDENHNETKLESARILQNQSFKLPNYEVDDTFKPASCKEEIHTVHEMVEFAKKGEVAIDARVLAVNGQGRAARVRLDTKGFLEATEGFNRTKLTLREADDAFLMDGPFANLGLVGDDFTPLLGGPFYKQLYYYDFMRMHATSFYAYNHDPFARSIVQITRDFTLGRGWRADCEDKAALALWDAFSEANDLYNMMDSLAVELSIYGETMIWWLPENQTKIGYRLPPNQQVPKGLIPRVRLVDPSVIWDIITYPEDITRVLAYQWVAPTQYQIYTHDNKTGQNVPSSKFIYQQIPSDEIDHWKVNSVSNEKRGRSDLMPVLGYLKRLRDSVNYGIVSMQKNMAWSVDTTVEGSPTDIDNYVKSQQALGTIPPAGSEFVHSKKVERKYMANEGGRAQNSPMFEWCISCIAAGSGIPVNYFGSHLSGGQTRASALVATEPVTKKFEKRRLIYEQILQRLSRRLFKQFGVDAEIEFTFPELVSQDRSAKLKDLALAEMQGWIKKEKIAPIAAKELDITDFDVTKDIGTEITPEGMGSNPLSSPALSGTPSTKPTAPTNAMRKQVADNES